MTSARNRAIQQANQFRRMTPAKRSAYMNKVWMRLRGSDSNGRWAESDKRFRWLGRLAKIDEALRAEGR